jgi:hypothetical protein
LNAEVVKNSTPKAVPQVGDVNGDGIPDILLPADGSIGIAIRKGSGTFLAPFAVGAGGGEFSGGPAWSASGGRPAGLDIPGWQ